MDVVNPEQVNLILSATKTPPPIFDIHKTLLYLLCLHYYRLA
jgi:hypothetical protein